MMCIAAATSARSILEKRIHYLTPDGKQGKARFWAIYLGNHDCKLTRKKPGQEPKEIVASMNLQFLSSGYIEGNGYGVAGKVQSLPTMAIKIGNEEVKINVDSIDYIYDFGRKVGLVSGRKGDFIINVEGDKKMAKKLLMREYKLQMYFGEEILKEGSEETSLSAFAFSPAGLVRAKKAQAEIQSQ
jgi:hypothetical protein